MPSPAKYEARVLEAATWRSAIGLSGMAALISAAMTYRISELNWTDCYWALTGVSSTFLASLLAMLPGLLVANYLKDAPRRQRVQFSKHLLDFWLPAVVGLITLDGYVNAVTGRSALFYLNLLIVKRAYRWLGSGGTNGNLMLFLPMLLMMVLSMLFARWLHAKLRRPANVRARVWVPMLLMTAGLAVSPLVLDTNSTGAATTMTTGWERPRLQVHRRDEQLAAPNVVLVIFESLRADALQPAVMPFASSIAENGIQFQRHYAGSNSSLLGLYGLLHGRPAAHSEQDLRANVPAAMLASFKRQGYRTAFFCGGDPAGYEEMDRLLGPASFDVYGVQSHEDWHRGDAWALDQLRTCLKSNGETPTLAILFVMSTHFDYGVEHSGPFVPAASDWSLLVPWSAHGSGHDAVVNRYRNAVHQADGLIGRALQQLLTDHTVVAITGDHGQSLYEDGTVAHWSRLSDAQTRVPLVIAGPGISRQRVKQATMHADVAQMLLDGAQGTLALPTPRPVLLVQSNPGLDYEDWALIDGLQRTAWRRQGSRITYRGPLDHFGQLIR